MTTYYEDETFGRDILPITRQLFSINSPQAMVSLSYTNSKDHSRMQRYDSIGSCIETRGVTDGICHSFING